MAAKAIKPLEVRSRQEWRNWLKEHYNSESEVWLVFSKRHADKSSLSYANSVKEALRFGWIDSLARRLDDLKYARKFTPRKEGSRWSSINCRRYEEMKARGLLARPGLERAPTARSGYASRPSLSVIPSYIEKRLKTNPRTWQFFGG